MPQPPPFGRAEDRNRVTFPSGDQVDLVATWVPVPGISTAPAVLLVHAFSRDRREWESFIPLFTQRGLAVLNIDLRGHGESTRQQGKTGRITVTPSLLKNPNGFPRDVEAACTWLRAKAPVLGVIGFQAGGNLAILATANSWADTAVAVSASTENLALLAGDRPSVPKGTLLLASENDPGRAASAKKLDEMGREPKKAVIFHGAAHGRALFESEAGARLAALDWLAERLHAVPPPSPTPTAVPTAVPTFAPEGIPAPTFIPTPVPQ